VQVALLGTGSAEGWPNPWCTCASCAAAREAGIDRGQTAALVDRRLLVDCGPEVPRAAARLGHDLTGVRTLLLTHSHPDHVGPAALLARHWAGRPEPLTVAGPPAALGLLRDWVGPHDPVTLRPLAAGQRAALDGYGVVALPAAHGDVTTGECLLYDVTAPDGQRLLVATDTGPLPAETTAAVAGRAYAVVLLECTGQRGGGHHDLPAFAETVAQLRRSGAISAGTTLAAVHLGHRNPPPAELERRLASLGAVAPRDGEVLRAGADAPAPPRPHRVLLLGGARSGKSAEAERRVAAEPAVTYVATGPSGEDDPDWAARLAVHRSRRPASWQTVETTDLAPLLADPPDGAPLLVDDLGLWLTAHLGNAAAADALVAAWRSTPARVVLVTNEVGSGVHPSTEVGRRFRDELGRLNARLAAESDEVWLVVAGLPQRLR
jgi:adenosylcobinamide kinase / adenosylcobinamide-phosphate guanylyltransferase